MLRVLIGGSYKAASFAASLILRSACGARASRSIVRAGDARRGAAEFGFGSAPYLLAYMGHARHRPKRLAEKLKQIREALGLSQREMAERLAERAGVKITSKNISKYERDKSVPFIEVMLAYSRLANVLMNEIVDDDLELNL